MSVSKVFTGAAVALALTACSQAAPAPKFDAAAMDALLSGAIESGDMVAASSLVFDEGKVVYQGAFGMADRVENVPAELDTMWRIYSMTKPITSAAVMKLAEDGKLNLDDPVSKYIPALGNMKVASMDADGKPKFGAQVVPMTVEDLILHRAGMGYGIFGESNPIESAYVKANLFDPTETLEQKMDKLGQLPLLAQPGDAWYYSFSIDVLGRIVEVVSEQSFGGYLQKEFFDPLGMVDTSFDVPVDKKSRFIRAYNRGADGAYTEIEGGQIDSYLNPEFKFESGGGGLVSTLSDYAKFCEMMLRGGELGGKRILSQGTVDLMMADQMDADDKFLMPWFQEGAARFGYGGSVVVSDTPEQIAGNGQSTGQWGWSGAANTIFYIDRPNDAFGILMLQYFPSENAALRDQWRVISHTQTRDDLAVTE